MKKYLILLICLFISAVYFNILQLPNKIVTGGLGGLSLIINYYFDLEPSIIIFMISTILLITGIIILGFKRVSGAIISSIVYPIFISMTKNINIPDINNLLIISIIIGILLGTTTGIVYKLGFSNGGLAILSEIIAKYTKISLPKTIFILNIIIVLIGGFSIGLERLIYATIILLINSIIISILLKNKYIK